MSVEITIVCDGCSAITAAARSAAKARMDNRMDGGKGPLPGGFDLCPDCTRKGRGTSGFITHGAVPVVSPRPNQQDTP